MVWRFYQICYLTCIVRLVSLASKIYRAASYIFMSLDNNDQSIGTRNFRTQCQKPVEYQYLDTVSLVVGAHSIRTGVDFRSKNNSFADIQRRTPAYQFSGKYTGDSLADLLLGDTQ